MRDTSTWTQADAFALPETKTSTLYLSAEDATDTERALSFVSAEPQTEPLSETAQSLLTGEAFMRTPDRNCKLVSGHLAYKKEILIKVATTTLINGAAIKWFTKSPTFVAFALCLC
jgi:hypothetical protein